MTALLQALRDGFSAVRRNWGLVLLVLLVNLGLAAVLATPLAGQLERELRHGGSSELMMYGFDHSWWKEWSERQTGWTASFGPDLFGAGFAFKNLDLLLRGQLPLGLFARGPEESEPGAPPPPPAPDGVILGLGALYLLAQTFLAGGLLGVLRAPEGGWTVRGLLHGSGFYAGRLLRVMLLALLAAGFVFWLDGPAGRWFNGRAREAVSETSALAFSLARYAILFLMLVGVHLVSSYAKVIVVLEERSSAALALVSSLGFCLRHPARVFGQWLLVGGLGAGLLLLWSAADGSFETTGYKTQLVTLVLAEALLLGRIGLRLSLLASQVSLYRRLVSGPA
jgi:hypothetical protein